MDDLATTDEFYDASPADADFVSVEVSSFYDSVDTETFSYLSLREQTFSSLSDDVARFSFIGFGAVGICLILSLGISVLIRILKAA